MNFGSLSCARIVEVCSAQMHLTRNTAVTVIGRRRTERGKKMPVDINEFDREIYTFAQTEKSAKVWFMLCTRAQTFNSPKMLAYMFRSLFAYVSVRIIGENEVAKELIKQAAKDDPKPWQFVNVTLTDEEISDAEEQLQDTEVLWELINAALEEGYKLSLTVEEESGSFCASLTGKFCPLPNRDKTISGWHETAVDSLRIVMYKHQIKLGGVWKSPDGGQKRKG